MTIEFFYFDLGNVLWHFCHRRACTQMGEIAGVDPERYWQLIFTGGLEVQCELGQLDGPGLYEILCRETNTRPEFAAMERAGADIFDLNVSIMPLVANMKAAGLRLGILSNTSASHWNYVTRGRFALFADLFEPNVLSFEEGAMKPDPRIYAIAAEKAGVPPERIFFTDDRAENVAAACAAGIDAVVYESTPQLVRELWRRGVRCNY